MLKRRRPLLDWCATCLRNQTTARCVACRRPVCQGCRNPGRPTVCPDTACAGYADRPDIRVENLHGSIVLVRPLRDKARAWLEDHVSAEATWWGGGLARALVVEPRYLADLVAGAQADGLIVR